MVFGLVLGVCLTLAALLVVAVLWGQPTLARFMRRRREEFSPFQLADAAMQVEMDRRRRKQDTIQAMYRVVDEDGRRRF